MQFINFYDQKDKIRALNNRQNSVFIRNKQVRIQKIRKEVKQQMGQTCSFAEQKEGHNLYREVVSSDQVRNFKRKLLQSHLHTQQTNIRGVTLLQGSHELIYQFSDENNSVAKLPVNKWNQDDEIQDIQIEQFLGDGTSFICKIKYYFQIYPVWKIVQIFRTPNLLKQTINNFAISYFTLYRINQLQNIHKNFIHAENCSLQTKKLDLKSHLSHSFIIESQLSLFPFVPLRHLGFFMRFNKICWQDNQFSQIIKKCFHFIQDSKPCGTFVFQQWLIDTNGQLFPIGALVRQLDDDYQRIYLKQLVFYLCETLYGHKISVSCLEQLRNLLQQRQKSQKFKHSKSVHSLLHFYEKGLIFYQKQDDIIEVEDKTYKLKNINNYVASYRAKKRAPQASIQLALIYIDFGEYQKAKQILYEKLYLLMYDQMGSSFQKRGKQEDKKMPFKKLDGNELKKLRHKYTTRHEIMIHLQSVLSYLICLERILSSSYMSQELQYLIHQYEHISLILSSRQRNQHNYKKSLLILQQTRQFLQGREFWQLELHIALCYFYMGDFQKAQIGIEKSLIIDENQANICFMIMFYSVVLNWQKALQIIQEYQSMISEDCIYQLLISKIFLSKSLTITKRSSSQERVNSFYQTIKVASRVINRENVPQFILCQAYEIIADGYFYLKKYLLANQFYQKSLALCSSIEHNKTKTQSKNNSYEPAYMKSASLQYTRSRTLKLSRNSTIERQYLQQSQILNRNNQTHLNLISRKRQSSHNKQNSIIEGSYDFINKEPSSFIYQQNLLFDFNKKAILLTSIANCYLMEQNYTQAIAFYQKAESKVLNHNKDLIKTIEGSKAVCYVQMGKHNKTTNQQNKQLGKLKLQKIIQQIKDQNPLKLQNDVNYIFLLNELNSISI